MNTHLAVTVVAARFDRNLKRNEDMSGHPDGAVLFSGGTETDWATEDGLARRDRSVRVWLTIWPDPESAAEHYADRGARIPILSQAVETMAVLCHPFACHGTSNWTASGEAGAVFPVLAPRPGKDARILVMTTLGIGDPTDGLVEFGRGVTKVRAAFKRNPSVLVDVNMLPDIPMIDGPTLTIWQSEQEMMAGAYRSEPHRTTMTMRNGATARASFARMAIIASEGTWDGVDLNAIATDPVRGFRNNAP